jgi:hypothetical protein
MYEVGVQEFTIASIVFADQYHGTGGIDSTISYGSKYCTIG